MTKVKVPSLSVRSLCEQLLHVLFDWLRFHFNDFWRDVGAHASSSFGLCLGVGFLPELLQPDMREKTSGTLVMAKLKEGGSFEITETTATPLLVHFRFEVVLQGFHVDKISPGKKCSVTHLLA